MEITHIASFLVPPGKNIEKPPDVRGAMLELYGPLYDLLRLIFEKSNRECNIPIRFTPAEDGSQNNEARNNILNFLHGPSLDTGRIIAERLRSFTTQKPAQGLLFLIVGSERKTLKLVISRFPADQGIIAEAREDTLKVEFIERIFMKSSESYKAALYQDTSLKAGFWNGFAVDKQANELANYWIYDFLCSDFLTTSKGGTRWFAVAVREASKIAATLETKQQLVAFTTLVHGAAGQTISVNDIAKQYHLPKDAKDLIVDRLPYPELADHAFILDAGEFSKHATYASIELSNGAILTAPPDQFDTVFEREYLDEEFHTIRFTTEGQIIDERVKGRK